MLTDAELSDWDETYRRDCLAATAEVEWVALEDSPVHGRFICQARTADDLPASVDHFLLRVPR